MAPITELSHLANPLVTSAQLETSSTQLDGVPKDLEDSVRYETARLMQVAGLLLRLPQELIAQSVVILFRYWIGPDGGSMLEYDLKDVASACLYLSAKPSGGPVTPRQVLTVFAYLSSLDPKYHEAAAAVNGDLDSLWHLSSGDYERARGKLYQIEAHILRVLGFQTHVALPYTLCINYIQTLDVFNSPGASVLAKRAFAHLNTALLSPQLVYLTYQPTALATAAIYLAAREVNTKLPETSWWEVFDVDREDLGFLVVAMLSVEGFATEERRKWDESQVPLTIDALRTELERRKLLEDDA